VGVAGGGVGGVGGGVGGGGVGAGGGGVGGAGVGCGGGVGCGAGVGTTGVSFRVHVQPLPASAQVYADVPCAASRLLSAENTPRR
jgi:hypothetical protein